MQMGLSSERQESEAGRQLYSSLILGTSSKVIKGDLETSLRMREEKIILSQDGPLMEFGEVGL